MIGLDLGLFVNDDGFQIKFEIFVVLLVFEVANDILRGQKVDIDFIKETHADLRLFLENPEQLFVYFTLILKQCQ